MHLGAITLNKGGQKPLFIFEKDMELTILETKIKEKLATIGYELVSIKQQTIDKEKYLSIVVDRVEEIDMDAIVEVSNVLNAYIDELDPISTNYTLDICSLGAEKPLKIDQLDKYVSRYIHVHLTNPIEGENIYEGTLESLTEEEIKLSYKVKTRTKTVDITKSNISKIRLAIKF